jgi:hypothetical protein
MLLASFALYAVLAALGVPPPIALPGALLSVVIAVINLGRRLDEPLLVRLGIAFIVVPILAIVFDATHGYDAVAATAAAIAIGALQLGAILGGRAAFRGARRWSSESARRHLAARRGWRFAPRDPEVVARVGAMLTQVEHGGRGVVHVPVESPGPGLAVVSGQLGDVAFAVFDFTSARGGPLQTAWALELPAQLPYLGLPFAFCSDRWGESDPVLGEAMAALGWSRESLAPLPAAYYTESPAFARELLTPDVRRLTVERLPSWWIDGSYLLSVESEPRGAGPALVIERLGLLAELLALFSPAAMSRWAQPPGPTGARSRAWRAGAGAASRATARQLQHP